MYEIISDCYKKHLNHKNIQLNNIDNEIWLSINKSSFLILKDGIVFNYKIKLWDEFDKKHINLLCSKIPNSKKYNLRNFLNNLYQNKEIKRNIISTDEEAYITLRKCKKDIAEISERLDFYTKMYENVSKLQKNIYNIK